MVEWCPAGYSLLSEKLEIVSEDTRVISEPHCPKSLWQTPELVSTESEAFKTLSNLTMVEGYPTSILESYLSSLGPSQITSANLLQSKFMT